MVSWELDRVWSDTVWKIIVKIPASESHLLAKKKPAKRRNAMSGFLS